MNFECPKCGSMEFTQLSFICADGYSDFEARSRGWGLLAGSGRADLGCGTFKTKGQIQCRLSQRLSPPSKWSCWKIIFGGLGGLLILDFFLRYIDTFLHYGGNFGQQLAWFGYTWLGVVAITLCIAVRHNVWTVPKRHRLWDRSFMCRRCGHVLQLPEPIHSASRTVMRETQP